MFNAILLQSSYDLDYLQGQTQSTSSAVVRDHCLSVLRQRILDAVVGVSDATIVSVAMLAALEHDQGNFTALNAHMKGLKRMVEMRGGLKVLRAANVMAANFVFW